MDHKKFFLLFLLIFLTLCPAFLIAKDKSKHPKIDIGSLPDDTPGPCGCFAWKGRESHKEGKLIYQEGEVGSQKFLGMKLSGKLRHLHWKKKGKDKYLKMKVGEDTEDLLEGEGFQVQAKWKATDIDSPPDEESARSVLFDVSFDLSFGKVSTKVEARGYCGC